MGQEGWGRGRCVSGRGTLHPLRALINPAFPVGSIFKITFDVHFKDEEACNTIIGKKMSDVCSTSENYVCLKMMEKKCNNPGSKSLGNC